MPFGVIGDLAGRSRRQDQCILGRADRGETMGEAAEPAFERIAPRRVDHRDPGARALFLDCGEHGLDADALAAHVGFLPYRGVDRDHEALAAGLDAIAAKKQHDHGFGGDPGGDAIDRAVDLFAASVFHELDLESFAAEGLELWAEQPLEAHVGRRDVGDERTRPSHEGDRA